ncbi:hypothetical protein PHPALM_28228 [Phytophthora palmivora]|uniref:Uncharacterized protein n=1 Tax=Phytophthora palmivora TaxID=4796 RepID=A0A2P4XAL2_9STRA|nr:hypothetical protein PHPALM_28228 [Phytophthora palmivora]
MTKGTSTLYGSRSVHSEEEDAPGHASDEEKDDEDHEEKAEFGYVKTTTELLGEVGELSLQVGRMGVPRLVMRYIAAEFGEDADDEDQGVPQGEPMGFRVTSRPSPWILSDWNLDLASVELLRWRGKLRKAFEVQIKPRLLTTSDGGSQLGGMEPQLGEMLSKTPYLKAPKGGQPATNPSKITTMKTPETKKGERFRATPGTPYFEDSHMLSPKKSRTRLGRNKWKSEEDNSAEAGDDSDDDHGYRPSQDETVKDQVHYLSNDKGDQGGSQYLELRSHFDQSASTRYYSAKRKDKETICDFLTRLNGYARTAKIQYERGGVDAADHVEQFLLNCGDDDIMDMLYPLQLNDIHRVEQIINKTILGEKRKKQRDRLVSGRSRDEMRRDDRRNDRRRDDKLDGSRDDERELVLLHLD